MRTSNEDDSTLEDVSITARRRRRRRCRRRRRWWWCSKENIKQHVIGLDSQSLTSLLASFSSSTVHPKEILYIGPVRYSFLLFYSSDNRNFDSTMRHLFFQKRVDGRMYPPETNYVSTEV